MARQEEQKENNEGDEPPPRRLCADTPTTPPRCRPLPGGPGAPVVRLANVGSGVATAMEFVAAEAEWKVSGGRRAADAWR